MGKGRDRLYFREGRGWYMDLRDLGGGQKACIPDGKRGATQDRDEATAILSAKLKELKAERESGAKAHDPRLDAYAKRHLTLKADNRRDGTVDRDERSLRNVLAFFGDDVRLSEIDVEGLTDYLTHRRRQPGNRKGTTISEQTLLHELHALSNLFRRAVAERKAAENPVSRLTQMGGKPTVVRDEAVWLEPGEAARLLGAAGKQDADPHNRAFPHVRPLLATLLLTGARKMEVFGMLARDVDLDDGVVHVRPNRHRRLKRPHHRRWVPLWPQLRGILEPYLEDHPRKPDALLFPSPNGGTLCDIRGSLSKAVGGAKINKRVTLHTLRHTYAAARLQTTDHGEPVSPYTVMRELGHRSLKLIEETYGHLGRTRDRSPVVEYREGQVVGEIAQAKGA